MRKIQVNICKWINKRALVRNHTIMQHKKPKIFGYRHHRYFMEHRKNLIKYYAGSKKNSRTWVITPSFLGIRQISLIGRLQCKKKFLKLYVS